MIAFHIYHLARRGDRRSPGQKAGRRALGLTLFTLAWLSIPAICFGQSPKLAPDLCQLDPSAHVTLIIQFAPGSDASRQGVIDQGGAAIQAHPPLINAHLVTLAAYALQGLANNPNVVYLELTAAHVAPIERVEARC
jgi:hypothetical protein